MLSRLSDTKMEVSIWKGGFSDLPGLCPVLPGLAGTPVHIGLMSFQPQTKIRPVSKLSPNFKTCHGAWKKHLYLRKIHWQNKMKPTNPNADTYVEKQRLNTYLSQFPANPFVEHPDLTHWGDTLVGHPCLTLLRYTLVRHSCITLWFDTLAGHSCLTLF